jgi:hypothetical protein
MFKGKLLHRKNDGTGHAATLRKYVDCTGYLKANTQRADKTMP